MAIMAILKVFVFVKFVEVYGAFAFAPSYMCLYTCIVEFLIFSPSTRISEANGITIGVLKAMVIYMYKLDKKNVPVEVFNNKNSLIFSDVENHKETPASVEKMEVDDEEDEERKTTIRMCKTGALKFTNLYYSTCSSVLYVC